MQQAHRLLATTMFDSSNSSREPGRNGATLDELFDVLSQPQRRHILTALADANPRDEREFVPADFTSDERGTGAVAKLHHIHLPRLEEAGLIEWDPDSATITRGPRFDEIAPLVELLMVHQDALPAGWP